MNELSKWERVQAAVRGEQVDRVPVSFWKHNAVKEWSPRALADLTLQQFHDYDLDFIKLTPTGIYPYQDWGPTVRFSRDDREHPECVDAAVKSGDDWEGLSTLDINSGALGRELDSIRFLSAGVMQAAPILMTIYSPLTVASMLCSTSDNRDCLVEHIRAYPAQLHSALSVIRDVVQAYALACLDAGASGMFIATTMANLDLLTRAEYEEFGCNYDLPVLEAIREKSQLTFLHVCRKNIMFDLLMSYPVDVLHWNNHAVEGPTLRQARQKINKGLSGGVAVETLVRGTPDDVISEVHSAISETNGTGLILTPTCTISGFTPKKNLRAFRSAVDDTFI